MRLADFILNDIEPILGEWEDFARRIWPRIPSNPPTEPAILRDHAEEMLRAAVFDMKSDQTTAQQTAKSKGEGGGGPEDVEVKRASVAHGTGRVASGFDLTSLIAEYRALRASVIRRWRESGPTPNLDDLEDLTRFSEFIDQSLAEAVQAYTRVVEREKEQSYEEQVLRSRELRDINEALLKSSIEQQELSERATAAEAQSREEEERYRTLFELGPVAIYSTDAAGVIQNFNHPAAEMWGRVPERGDTDERFCGSYKMFRPDGTFIPHEQCPMADVLRGVLPSVKDAEMYIERPDGSRIVVIVTILPLKNQAGQITGGINCFYDITSRKKAEEELRQTRQEAQDANRAKDRFLAALSHELRTPLTPVLMTISALELETDLAPDLVEDLKMIRRNVELQCRLIDDLLDVSRITSGKLRLTFERLDINELIESSCKICGSTIREKGIHLHVDLAPDADYVQGDSARLQQVFWNLLNNAAKFTPSGGDLFVSSRNINDQWVRVTVRDTGRGIAPAMLGRIFDAFDQGDPGVTQKFGGLGLGLAICRVLVERHHGAIHAQSEGADKGATFTVELPLIPAKALENTAQTASSGKEPQLIPLRLLVVEDNTDTAAVLSRLLTSCGHSVLGAATATQALALAPNNTFDLIISDVGLPDVTGHELMKQLKDKYGYDGIAMSGYGSEEDVAQSKEAGFSDHLVKPVNLEQLERSIRRIARKKASPR